ncbi:11466_t:CDS:1, partial [Scutellospora calospora]
PTKHTLYELVFEQYLLCYFNIIEKWKKHNINMEKNLSNLIKDSENSKDINNNDYDDFNDTNDYKKLLQQYNYNSGYLK